MDNQGLVDTSQWPALGATQSNTYRVSDEMVDMRRPAQPARTAKVHALPQDLLFSVDRSALIIVDMQNDFCHEEGWIASMGVDVEPARALSGSINRATAGLRAHGVPIIWLNWGVRPDRLNLSPGTQHPFNPNGKGPGLGGALPGSTNGHTVLAEGSWGAQIIDDLVQDGRDIHISKHRISGFWDTPLNSILNNLGVKTLLFAGVNADHCVLGTLMDANFHGYDTILLEDCTGTTSPDFCMQATLHNVRFCFGFTTTSDDLITGLSTNEQ